MSANFPISLDSYATISSGDTVSESHPNDRGDAIEALEAKVGVDSSAVATSHDYLLTHLPAQVQNWDIGAYELRAQTLNLDKATGTAPMTIASTTVVSNLNVDQVDGKDSTDFVLCDGTQALTANWDVGAYTITALKFTSDQTTGTAPFTVASTTKVTNLNADKLDGADKPTGDIVGTSDTQTLTNKTLTSPDINGGTADALTSLTVANSVDIGAYELRAATLEADIATGTAPLTIASTTKVSNLNADKWDGEDQPLTTRGDLLYMGASALARLAKGTSGQVLTMGANDPVWSDKGTVYDSGWFQASTTSNYTKTHSLGTTNIITKLYWASDNSGSGMEEVTQMFNSGSDNGSFVSGITTTQLVVRTGSTLSGYVDGSGGYGDRPSGGYLRVIAMAMD